MSTLTIEKYRQMQRKIHNDFVKPMVGHLFGMQIQENPDMLEQYTETATFKGHPVIQWLAKHLGFNPDVTATYVRHRPSSEVVRLGNVWIMHPATAKQLREQIAVR